MKTFIELEGSGIFVRPEEVQAAWAYHSFIPGYGYSPAINSYKVFVVTKSCPNGFMFGDFKTEEEAKAAVKEFITKVDGLQPLQLFSGHTPLTPIG